MVRLERVLYERVVNIAALGRARNISGPRKWVNHNPVEYNAVQAGWKADTSPFTKIMEKILYPFYKRFWWGWQRDLALQRGYAMDDFYVYTEKDLRRSPFYEHVWRDSCHPYQWLMYKYRRFRYYKIERVAQGFYVPEHLRDEVKKRTWAQTVAACNEWDNFMYRNYASDLTPTTYDTRGKLNPLEVFNQYGLARNESWERFFYNEEDYDFIDPEDYEKYVVRPGGYDVETTEGRMQFENKVNTLISDFPGLVTPEGEHFDFENFYMKWSLIHGKDTARFDQAKLNGVYDDVKYLVESKDTNLLAYPGEDGKVGTSTVGTEWPARMTENTRRAFQN